MVTLVDGLCQDHANFGKVLNVIESQAEAISAGAAPDLDIIAKAVAYLGGYPSLFHHPVENALCERLKKARPAVKASADAIMAEHAEVAGRLAAFRKLVEDALAGRTQPDLAFAEAAVAFVDAEWRHMEHERSALFPAALAVLSAADWRSLEERSTLDRDVMLRGVVPEELVRFHELMEECRDFDDQRLRHRAREAAATG